MVLIGDIKSWNKEAQNGSRGMKMGHTKIGSQTWGVICTGYIIYDATIITNICEWY